MTVKDGHAPDHWIREIHNDVDGATIRNIHCVHPQWVGDRLIVFGVWKEMDLMDVHVMQFPGSVDNLPVLKGSNLSAYHRRRIGRELVSVNVKAILVFRERHDEPGGTFCSASKSSFLRPDVGEVCDTLDRGPVTERGTISAKIIDGFGSPFGPVSTHRETRRRVAPAAGPVTMASTLPAGGNKT